LSLPSSYREALFAAPKETILTEEKPFYSGSTLNLALVSNLHRNDLVDEILFLA